VAVSHVLPLEAHPAVFFSALIRRGRNAPAYQTLVKCENQAMHD